MPVVIIKCSTLFNVTLYPHRIYPTILHIAWHCILVKEHWLYNLTTHQSVNLIMTNNIFLITTADNDRLSSSSSRQCEHVCGRIPISWQRGNSSMHQVLICFLSSPNGRLFPAKVRLRQNTNMEEPNYFCCASFVMFAVYWASFDSST